MKTLTKEQQEVIASQMVLKSRDIDMIMINTLDGTMPKEYVLDGLMFYQAKDGGFQGGLYIDNYNTNTSVYQIYEAFRLLYMAGFTSKDLKNEMFFNIVNRACNYLYNRATFENNMWYANVKTNDDFAHAKIFSYTKENEEILGYHPSAALFAYTLYFNEPTKAYYKKALKYSEILIDDILNNKVKFTKYEMKSFNIFYNIIKELGLFSDKLDELSKVLISKAEEMVTTNYKDVECVRPLNVALYLNSEKLDKYKNEELDFIISSIANHGLWDHIGNWGYNNYPEEDSAMIKWVGAESVNNYYLLKINGRID